LKEVRNSCFELERRPLKRNLYAFKVRSVFLNFLIITSYFQSVIK